MTNDEREFTRFKTWAFKEYGPMPREKLLPLWQAWKAALLINDLKPARPKAEPLVFDDGSMLQPNTFFADMEGDEPK